MISLELEEMMEKQKENTAPYFTIKINLKFYLKIHFGCLQHLIKFSVGWDASMERICTYGLFEYIKSKEKILVFNTHFDHIGNLARKKSSDLILKRIDNINNENLPVILTGDFQSRR